MLLMWVVLAQYGAVSDLPEWLGLALQSASWAVAAFLGGLILLIQALLLALVLMRRSDLSKSPDAEVMLEVVSSLFLLQDARQNNWSTASEVAKMLDSGLNGLAAGIEYALRHKAGQIEELITEARSIGAGVRRLRRNVVLGGVKGLQTVQKALTAMLVPLARGDSTALEHADPAPVTVHWAFWFLLRILNIVAIAALPYIALSLLRSGVIPIANAEAMATHLDVIAAWWAVAVVLTALQPRAKETMEVAGKLAGK